MKLVRRLAEGVGAWLQFEQHCNRVGLFSERYLSFPIGQILGAVYGSHVHAEYPHPVLRRAVRGSPPRIDFAVLRDDDSVSHAIESKWIGDTTISVESIIWDLIRLELLCAHSGAEGYFLLGGAKRKLLTLFNSELFAGPAGVPGRVPILRTASNYELTLPLVPTQPYRTPLIAKVLENRQDVLVPHVIHSTRSEPFPADCLASQFQVYVWRVRASKKRQVFRPADSRYYRASQSLDPSPSQSSAFRGG